jgi:hypothetical protein
MFAEAANTIMQQRRRLEVEKQGIWRFGQTQMRDEK